MRSSNMLKLLYIPLSLSALYLPYLEEIDDEF